MTTFMSVIDIASAYRSVPILPQHFNFQGFVWDFDDGKGEIFMRENRLSFGLRCAPFIFDLLSRLVVDMARARGVHRVVNYLDDLIVSGSCENECRDAQNVLLGVLRAMGFEISWKKVSQPSTTTVFLGICINSIKMSLSLPLEKISKLLSLIDKLLEEGKASKKELERLGGLLSHFSSVTWGDRTFCRRVFDLFRLCSRTRKVKLNEEIPPKISKFVKM